MSFLDKIKGTFQKIKEENGNFKSTMLRINSSGFYGNVNRKVKDGSFWEGSYLSIEGAQGVIYGSHQEDYPFRKETLISCEKTPDKSVTVSVGNTIKPAVRYLLTFADGKTAQADILLEKEPSFRQFLALNV